MPTGRSRDDNMMKNSLLPEKKRILATLGAVMLALTTALTPVTGVMATESAVKKSNYVIRNMDAAQSALLSLVSQRDISALVYLKDSYTIRSDADPYSDSVATVASGQLVYITGVGAIRSATTVTTPRSPAMWNVNSWHAQMKDSCPGRTVISPL